MTTMQATNMLATIQADAPRRARHRRIEDGGGRRLELEDRRQGRVVPVGATSA